MEEDRCQKVVGYKMPMGSISIEEINALMEEGFEVKDIVPYMARRQGFASGIEINRILFHLAPSQRKTILSYHYVKRDHLGEYINKINEIIQQEYEKDRILLKIIPIEEIRDPNNGNGLGWGAVGLSLFFVNG